MCVITSPSKQCHKSNKPSSCECVITENLPPADKQSKVTIRKATPRSQNDEHTTKCIEVKAKL